MVLLLAGCGPHRQSVIDPQSPEASAIAEIWWVMLIIGTIVFVVTMAFLFVAVYTGSEDKPPGGSMRFVWAGGIIIPSIILVGILIYSMQLSTSMSGEHDGLVIEVEGRMWWWEVRYPEAGVITANEIHIPAGERVQFKLTSGDVIHSFWIPNLHGKLDMTPGKVSTISIRTNEPGVWRGQCAEFCGTQHAWMAFEVVAHEPEEFRRWLAERQKMAGSPRPDRLAHGEQVFFEHGCQNCHAVRGTEATTNIGPDLTHLGNRRTLGAAVVPNDFANLAGWIADPQSIKPGNLMPASYIPSEDLRALVDYLLSIDTRP
jgi:cytochrome c oxidase subunit II